MLAKEDKDHYVIVLYSIQQDHTPELCCVVSFYTSPKNSQILVVAYLHTARCICLYKDGKYVLRPPLLTRSQMQVLFGH